MDSLNSPTEENIIASLTENLSAILPHSAISSGNDFIHLIYDKFNSLEKFMDIRFTELFKRCESMEYSIEKLSRNVDMMCDGNHSSKRKMQKIQDLSESPPLLDGSMFHESSIMPPAAKKKAVDSRKCEYPGCTKSASFNVLGSRKRRFCKTHKEPDMQYVRKRKSSNSGDNSMMSMSNAMLEVEGMPLDGSNSPGDLSGDNFLMDANMRPLEHMLLNPAMNLPMSLC